MNNTYPRRHAPAKPQARPAFGAMLLSWLIPGYGYMRNGQVGRGIFFFVTLQLTFLIGVVLRGSVLIPAFSFRDPAFNVVNILTFFTQIFNGGLSLVSMLPELFGPGAAIFPNLEDAMLADLGIFYILVSGGMSYFVLTSTWDKFYSANRPTADSPTDSSGESETEKP